MSRAYYITPAVYIEFFNLFNTALTKRKGELQQNKDQLEKGVEKLQETNEKVHEMEGILTSLRPKLQEKAAETEKTLAKLKVQREIANETHMQISSEEETVKKIREEAVALAAEAQADYDKTKPFLDSALAAVEDLKNKKSDLAVVKSFVKPAQLIVEVMEAVFLLCGKSPD